MATIPANRYKAVLNIEFKVIDAAIDTQTLWRINFSNSFVKMYPSYVASSLSEFVSLQLTLPISFVIENLELDQCILPVLKSNVIVLLKFKNDDYDTKNPTRWADTDSRDYNIYVL